MIIPYLVMIDNLNLLISLLRCIDFEELIPDSNERYSITHPLVNAATYLANEYLIADDGHPDRRSIDIIIDAGFHIYPEEQDRFGWLTGRIQLSRGVIIFGQVL